MSEIFGGLVKTAGFNINGIGESFDQWIQGLPEFRGDPAKPVDTRKKLYLNDAAYALTPFVNDDSVKKVRDFLPHVRLSDFLLIAPTAVIVVGAFISQRSLLGALPDLMSAGNMVSGAMALKCVENGRDDLALMYQGIAAILDMFDGKVAGSLKNKGLRKDNSFGMYADDIADCFNFAVGMGATIFTMLGGGTMALMSGGLYAALGITRLTKFTLDARKERKLAVPNETNPHAIRSFKGMPVPAGTLGALSALLLLSENTPALGGIAAAAYALAMASFPIKFPHLGDIAKVMWRNDRGNLFKRWLVPAGAVASMSMLGGTGSTSLATAMQLLSLMYAVPPIATKLGTMRGVAGIAGKLFSTAAK